MHMFRKVFSEISAASCNMPVLVTVKNYAECTDIFLVESLLTLSMFRVHLLVRSSSQKHCKAEAGNSRRGVMETFSPPLAYHCSNLTYLFVDCRTLSIGS